MPIGFNLFSFDIFNAFRRAEYIADQRTTSQRERFATEADDHDEKERERDADIAFWGLAYYPVM